MPIDPATDGVSGEGERAQPLTKARASAAVIIREPISRIAVSSKNYQASAFESTYARAFSNAAAHHLHALAMTRRSARHVHFTEKSVATACASACGEGP
jgi:O-acetyl-ADP-ribose deacetylase (regulator of RNase III)